MEQVPDDEEHLWEILSAALEEAKKFLRQREVEGLSFKKKIFLASWDYMTGLVDFIEERSPVILKEYRQKLEDKVKELLNGTAIDEGRIKEVVIYADKICVDEETVRLRSHIENTRQELYLVKCRSQLDFIAPGDEPEANTILSKSSDLAISDKAIALKTEIEKVREQIQNIE